jgi:urease accessory protein
MVPAVTLGEPPVAGAARLPASGTVDVVVAAGAGAQPRLTHLFCTGSIAARPTPRGLWLVGASANPIGGDSVDVRLDIGHDAELEVRSASAAVARRGHCTAHSCQEVAATVGRGATLSWLTEPSIAARGACHETTAEVQLAAGAKLAWYDGVVLGRDGEEYGSWRSRLSIRRCERPVFVSDLSLGPAYPWWRSPAVLDGARCCLSLVVVDPDIPPVSDALTEEGKNARGGAMVLAAGGLQLVAVGDDYLECSEMLLGLRRRYDSLAWVPELP